MSGSDDDDEETAPLEDVAESVRSEAGSDDGVEGDDADSGVDSPPAGSDAVDATDTDGETEADDAESVDEPATRHQAPLDDIAREVERRRTAGEDEESDLFEEMDVGEVDAEEVWDALLGETDELIEEAEGKAVGAGAQAESVGQPGIDDREEFVIPKANFCGRCPYLAPPPKLACDHENTDIIAVVDSEHFRVLGCPFAGRDEEEFSGYE